MIKLQTLSLHRGSRQLLTDTSLTIHPGEKIGLVGANGSGKSTLFQLLLGNLQPDNGSLHIPKQWRIGHMLQEISSATRSALDFVIDGDKALRQIEAEIEQHAGDDTFLAALYSRLEEADGYTAKARAASLLGGLGFKNDEIENPIDSFSGGWRVRLALAQALMCPADLLLLDEPTNHLDLEATIWLENWLNTFQGTLIIVSHDRDFLDHVVKSTVHLEAQQLNYYRGGYSDFEIQRSERLSQQQALFEKQQTRVKEINAFVSRFRAKASKAKQAQSRVKELQRMELVAPAHSDSPFSFRIPCAEKCPQTLVNFSQATIGYDDEHCVKNINLSIHNSTRIALLGANGAGKSTLLKSIAGELALLSGEKHDNDALRIGYFAQHQLQSLDLNASPALHIQRVSPKASEQQIRTFLGSFDFQSDRVFEPIVHFSGGEKARLSLALIAWSRPNLLVLDEPTNHLDLEMRHALTVALQGFEGAIILVSHDRHLIRNTVEELMLVADQKIQDFDDDLEAYEHWLAKQANEESVAKKSAADTNSVTPSKKDQRQAAANTRALLKPLTNKIKKLESLMETKHQRIDEIETSLADTELYLADNKLRLQELLKEQGDIKQTLASTEEEWLMLQEELEALTKDLN
ncbi:ATP-binding cassette domain-containing protein [Aurantivibrio infirmus]